MTARPNTPYSRTHSKSETGTLACPFSLEAVSKTLTSLHVKTGN